MNSSFLRFLKPSPDLFCVLALTFAPVVLLVILYVFLVSTACITQTKQRIRNLSGLDFEISYMNCDTFGSSQSMSVFVSGIGDRNRTEIFTFDPIYFVDLPTVTVLPNEKRIAISVKWISSIYFQRHRWEDMAIDYDIGKITYPESATTVPAAKSLPP
jgi:hypothetical protein